MRRRVGYLFATWFGCGYVPIAPGTAGTLGAVPLYLAIRDGGPLLVVLVAVVMTAIGVWAAQVVVDHSHLKDPQIVVIDEVAGVLFTLAAAPASRGWLGLAIGVVLFRVFDSTKPWPANVAERRLPGGWGVVMDDVAAGIWGAVVLLALRALHIL